jgi:DNA-binding transcriptional ArsR family regulator
VAIRDEIHVLSREQLRVLANPLRLRILNRLCRRSMSTAELQRELGDAPSNLYHHVGKLVDAGLLRLVRTAPRRGAVERYYRAVAPGFTVPPELLVVGAEGAHPEIVATVRGMLEDALAALAESLRRGLSGPEPPAEVPMVTGFELRASRERIEELRRRIQALTEEILAGPDAGEGAPGYAFLVMFFPVAPGRSAEGIGGGRRR